MMKLSLFGKKLTEKTGIFELMQDLGKAMQTKEKKYMLGGGNPAHIQSMNSIFKKRMTEILESDYGFEAMIANYDTPQGKDSFLEAMAEFLNRQFNWNLSAKNICITNGSQSGFFMLFNILAGEDEDGNCRKILFPGAPEYIGYADQALHPEAFITHKSKIVELGGNRHKYHIDFDTLKIEDNVAGICVSRPTNPSGNVLTDEEILKLDALAKAHGIPLIIDNAYGLPFPGILFTDAKAHWNENVILSMSLSKLGLPGTRTGIVVASEEIVEAMSAANGVLSLASGTIGQVLAEPLIRDDSVLDLVENEIKPFYLERSVNTQKWIDREFEGLPYSVHVSEGALFLWIWLKDLPVSTDVLYERLKESQVIIVPGKYFFFGLDEEWDHANECIRISYAMEPADVEEGVKRIAAEVRKLYEGK